MTKRFAHAMPFSEWVSTEAAQRVAIDTWLQRVADEGYQPLGEPESELLHTPPELITITLDDGTTYDQPPHTWRIAGDVVPQG